MNITNALTHYNGGPEQAARHFNRNFAKAGISGEKRDLARNSLAVIRQKFRDGTCAGSFGVETFSETKYRRNIAAAQVNKFLENVKDI